jgi:hypothetical protein
VHLPDPHGAQDEFQRRGFVVVPNLLDASEQSMLLQLATALVQRRSSLIDRAEHGERLWYTVVTGDRIKSEATPLFSFYTDPEVVSWIRALTGSASVGISPHLRSSININCLTTRGQRYPWHRDAVPYTALLFLSSVSRACGGTFMIRAADGSRVDIQPASGTLLLMDGTRCPHAVAPLNEDTLRLTVPMVYPVRDVDRPAGLDDYLYGT